MLVCLLQWNAMEGILCLMRVWTRMTCGPSSSNIWKCLKLKKLTLNKYLQGGGALELKHCWWQCKNNTTTSENWQFLVNTYLPHDIGIPFLELCQRELMAHAHKEICTWMFKTAYAKPSKTRNSPNAHEQDDK